MSASIDQTTSDEQVVLSFDESLYAKQVVLGAAYTFLDHCYVHLDRANGKILVSLRPKVGDEDSWQPASLAGAFESEALSQAWRHEILQDNRELLERVSARVLAGAAGPAGLDDLLAEELSDVGEAFDDPLGIAVSWEEKYGSAEAKADESSQGEESSTDEDAS